MKTKIFLANAAIAVMLTVSNVSYADIATGDYFISPIVQNAAGVFGFPFLEGTSDNPNSVIDGGAAIIGTTFDPFSGPVPVSSSNMQVDNGDGTFDLILTISTANDADLASIEFVGPGSLFLAVGDGVAGGIPVTLAAHTIISADLFFTNQAGDDLGTFDVSGLSNFSDGPGGGWNGNLLFSAGPNTNGTGISVISLVITGTPVVSEPETVPANNLTIFRGVLVSGGLSETTASDDTSLNVNPGFTLNNAEAPAWLIFDGTLSTDSPSSLEVIRESQAGTPGLTVTTEAWNFTTSSFDEVDVTDEIFNMDSIVTVDLTAAIGDYVEGSTGDVQSRIGWRQTGFTLNFPWEARVDHVFWQF